MAQLRITDTGIGMDADALAKMFEPYFSTKAIGTGLGLTIAKRNIGARRNDSRDVRAGPRDHRHHNAAAGVTQMSERIGSIQGRRPVPP